MFIATRTEPQRTQRMIISANDDLHLGLLGNQSQEWNLHMGKKQDKKQNLYSPPLPSNKKAKTALVSCRFVVKYHYWELLERNKNKN